MDVVYPGGYNTIMKSAKQNPADKPRAFVLQAVGTVIAFSNEQDARRSIGDSDVLLTSADEFRSITAGWSSKRLVTVWNNIPGVLPVKKFTDRRTGSKRIWEALQNI